MAIEEYAQVPSLGVLSRRAVTGAIGRAVAGGRPGHIWSTGRGAGQAQVPSAELLVRGVGVDLDHLHRYLRVCGSGLTNHLPATYPHVLAFPLNLDLMTRPEFPFALIGLVHIGNTIDLRRPLDLADRFDLTARVEHLRAHERGRAVDVVTTATVDGDVVWQERSSYLHRTRPAPAAPGPRPAAAAPDDAADRPAAHWVVPANIGRAYASVSGDRNPIHTSTIAARLFGFPARIAHGMWAKARCLAALAGRLPEAYTVDVAFKAPILLGATVAYWTEESGPERRFGLYQPGSGRPHLLGSVTPD